MSAVEMAELRLSDITDLMAEVSQTTRASSDEEKEYLNLALSVLDRCARKDAILDPFTTEEVEQQLLWLHRYQSLQDQSMMQEGDTLLPVDNGPLLRRFAWEVLEGAWALSNMLDVTLPEHWTRESWMEAKELKDSVHMADYVSDASESSTYESDWGSDVSGLDDSDDDGSDDDSVIGAIQYAEAYF